MKIKTFKNNKLNQFDEEVNDFLKNIKDPNLKISFYTHYYESRDSYANPVFSCSIVYDDNIPKSS